MKYTRYVICVCVCTMYMLACLVHLSVSVYRTNTSKKDAISSILVPFNLSLLAKRNLSASWYRGIPTIDLTANLDTLKVRNMLV